MTVKLEVGKCYELDNGDKVIVEGTSNIYWPFRADHKGIGYHRLWFKEDGTSQSGYGGHDTPNIVRCVSGTPTYVSTTYTGCNYITAGKRYEVVGKIDEFGYFTIKSDCGWDAFCRTDSCHHLDGASWTVHDDTEFGTLEDLNVKPGDVVEFVKGGDGLDFQTEIFSGTKWVCEKGPRIYCEARDDRFSRTCSHIFRIISRAADTPRTWSELTDAEKGALLLAHQEGKVIEMQDCFGPTGNCWISLEEPGWLAHIEYRIKPTPVAETVTIGGRKSLGGGFEFNSEADYRDYTITFTTTDGKPDLDSARMEEV